jgi:hypothetical protein
MACSDADCQATAHADLLYKGRQGKEGTKERRKERKNEREKKEKEDEIRSKQAR